MDLQERSSGLRGARSTDHRRRIAPAATGLVVVMAMALSGTAAPQQVDYAQAERLLRSHACSLVSLGVARPNWIDRTDRFWYARHGRRQRELMLVDPVTRRRTTLADPPGGPRPSPAEDAVRYAPSPDGRWEAFIHDYNLWVRQTAGGDSVQLTTDGVEYLEYGIDIRIQNDLFRPRPMRPVLEWSPDSRLIAVARLDERAVARTPIYSSTALRPKLYLYPYPMPGDSVISTFDIHVVSRATGRNVAVQVPPQPFLTYSASGMSGADWNTVKWAATSDRLFFTHGTRGGKRIRLMEADPHSGVARGIIEESSDTYVWLSLMGGPPNWDIIPPRNDIIWFSERDGWGHLYRYTSDGTLQNRMTKGRWTVGTIMRVDPERGEVFFTGRGREPGNPFEQRVYRVRLNGKDLALLSPEAGDHSGVFTPSGRFFVDTYSSADTPPVSVLRSSANGARIAVLETSDMDGLAAQGWQRAKPFQVKARDGVTELHGIMYLPPKLDPNRKYPVLDHIYSGPHMASVRDWTFKWAGEEFALAQLGFVVIQLNHMGAPGRSKAFKDSWYGRIGDAGTPDHVAALKQLAERFPFIDLTRAGIYGTSGGGFATVHAVLRHPEVYAAAVATAGTYDYRSYHAALGETFQGLLVRGADGTDNYQQEAAAAFAANLKTKLLLIHGDMDNRVHPAQMLNLASALIHANRDFDMLMVPNQGHFVSGNTYIMRRRWDYFVRHLLKQEPPANYPITQTNESDC